MCVCIVSVCVLRVCVSVCEMTTLNMWNASISDMGWLWLVGSIKLQVSFAKEPYKRGYILQKRPMI